MAKIKQVRVKTAVQPRSAYNPKNIFGALESMPFRSITYDWDDPDPDVITWEHFLEKELAKVLQKQHIPWPKVLRHLVKRSLKLQEIKMAVSVKGQFVVGHLSWKRESDCKG